MAAPNPISEITEALIEAGGDALKACYQCGLCTATCPWNLVRNFLVRRIIHQAQLGLAELESEESWLCAGCGACVERCPRGVEIIDIFRAVRRIAAEYGGVPKALVTVLSRIKSSGNPWGGEREDRANWAKDLGIKTFTARTEFLYFSCCTPAYDMRTRNIALSAAAIMTNAGIDFGILGEEENCCGESVRKVGYEDSFQELAQASIAAYKDHGVQKVIVSSPHCYHTYRNEYPDLGADFEVIHIVQLLNDLIQAEKIKLKKLYVKKVAYHDPCFLGRHNKIFEEPRNVLESIPGLKLIELPDSREDSICCGGGGGRIWMETKKEERFSELRINQALEVGAEVLATSCPYCMLNIDDSLLAMDKKDILEIKDLAEIVQEVM
jgi:Fe-S oxidoreductase